MRMTRLLFTAVAVLLPARHATAIELGPRIGVPVEFVSIFDPRTRQFVRVSSARDFAVASDGTDFFVVWKQSALVGTVGPAGEPPGTTRAGVFGARIDAAGNVLDAVPIQLPLSEEGACPKFCPGGFSLAFAASSDSYLVCSIRAGGCVRVSSRGTLLDANPIPFLPAGTVTSDGRNHFVLAGNEMFSVNKHARVVAHPIAFTLDLGEVASDGDNFLSFTRDAARAPGITLFNTRGEVLNVTQFPFSASGAAVTFDGDEYLIFWSGPGPEGFGKYVTRVSSEGELLDTSARLPLPVPPPFARVELFFRMSFDGKNEVATWCFQCFFEKNGAPIAVIQKNDQDQITATLAGGFNFAGPMRKWLALASNSTGVSVVIVDGIRIFPPNLNLESFFPIIQFVTTWTPSDQERPGRGPDHRD
jgi:hypothetical protein